MTGPRFLEEGHLCRRPKLGIFRPDGPKLNCVAEPLRLPVGPCLELLLRPFKPVVLVPKGARRQIGPHDIVFPVRRRQNDSPRASELK